MNKVKCTVRVAIPAEIAVYADVTVTTTPENATNRRVLRKLLATQLKLWNTKTCAEEVVTVSPFFDHVHSYKDHIESALDVVLPKKSIQAAISMMKDELDNGTTKVKFEPVP